MKNLVCPEPRQLAYRETEVPTVPAGYALLRIRQVGICGTDLHAWEGTQPYFNYPRILGHELAAEIISVPSGHGFSAGEPVTLLPYWHCGQCAACRQGKTNCCVRLSVCGVHEDGGMREQFAVPASSLVHGDGLSLDELALCEPLAIGAHGVARAQVQRGEFVLVVGAGPIGLAAMTFAQLAGATVIALDVNTQRLDFCRRTLGIAHAVQARDADVLSRLQEITHGDMPAVVIDCTGNKQAINQAFQYMAHGGRYVLVGLQREEITFSHPEFHKREGTLLSSRNATRADFEQVLAALRNKQILPAHFITHRIPFHRVAEEFHTWLDPAQGVIKAMVHL